MIKCLSNDANFENLRTSNLAADLTAGTGLARPTNPLGAPSCPKLASRELLGSHKNLWDTCGYRFVMAYLVVNSEQPFVSLCDNIRLGSSGVVGLHCQNSSLESGCVCSGFVVPIAPILLVSMGRTFAFLQNWLVRSSGMEDSAPTENEPEDS